MAQLKDLVVTGNARIVGSVYCSNFIGNASTATKLATARTIALTGSVTGSGTFDGSGNLSIATTTNHSHNYAGSSSAGGSATSAVKLDTATAGSATQPVYFTGGKPAACTYTLGKSVPSNAVFTDTHYASGTIVNNSNTATSNTSSALSNGNVYLNHIENGAVKNSHKITGSGATTVTSDASGNIVISSTDNNTTYSAATQSAQGLMSATDKKKLDGIATGANAYSHPTTSGNKHIPSGGSSGQILRWSADGTAAWGADNNTTYSTGTASASGLTKLYTGKGSSTDGAITQSATTDLLNNYVLNTSNLNNTYGSLESFWTYCNSTFKDLPCRMMVVRCKFTNGWGPIDGWFRCIVSEQNTIGNGQWDIGGTIIADNATNIYYGIVTGGVTNTSDLKVTWKNLSHDNNYLPLSGGTITGTLYTNLIRASQNIVIDFGGVIMEDGEIMIKHPYTNTLYLQIFCDTSSSYIRGIGNGLYCDGNINPETTSTYNLGTSSRKWSSVYASTGTIQTSDRTQKNTIEDLSLENAQKIILNLKPSTYKMNDGTSGRTHWGFISQDIEELLDENGFTSLDFAGFIKSPKMEKVEIIDEETGEKTQEERVIEGEYNYSLRYDEFISPIVKVVQDLCEKVKSLEQEIEILKNTQ